MNERPTEIHDASSPGHGNTGGNDVVVSLIRTYVPILVGVVAGWLAARGFGLDQQTQSLLIAVVTGGCVAVYYTLVRLLEQRWPGLGALLGTTRQPSYRPPSTSTRPRRAGARKSPKLPKVRKTQKARK